MPEAPYEMATRHVAEQEAQIQRQRVLIAHLSNIGALTDRSEDLLRTMENLLDIMRADLQRIAR